VAQDGRQRFSAICQCFIYQQTWERIGTGSERNAYPVEHTLASDLSYIYREKSPFNITRAFG
jgi:hypothetical protein